jgi:hypothetical protein
MKGIEWIVVIPVLIGGATLLWALSRNVPGWAMVVIGIVVRVIGGVLTSRFPASAPNLAAVLMFGRRRIGILT